MAIQNDISTDLFRGENKIFAFTIQGTSNIVGWTFRFIITASEAGLVAGSTEPILFEATVANGLLTVIDTTARTVEVLLPAEATDWSGPWKPKVGAIFYHSLKRIDDGVETILEHGKLAFQAANQVAE